MKIICLLYILSVMALFYKKIRLNMCTLFPKKILLRPN